MIDLEQLKEAILAGDARSAKEITTAAMAENISPNVLLDQYLIPTMDEVGRRFECGETFVPELMLAGRAMTEALKIMRPVMAEKGIKAQARVVIGTVQGDLHDIGKNLVASMLEGGGYEVIDLGVDVAPEKFIAAIQEKQPEVMAMSALLTTTMPAIGRTIEAVSKAGVRDRVKIIIGGAPVSQDYATSVGADGYSENANSAVGLVRQLLNVASA